jgi:hypothetical protein
METLEIIGIILIFIGVVYIFLQGLGKLSDKGGEIETKILSLKGGAGLILVALGIVLLAMGGGLLAGIPEKLPIPDTVKGDLGMTTPAKTSEPSTSASKHLTNNLSSTLTQGMPESKTVVLTAIDKESGGISYLSSIDHIYIDLNYEVGYDYMGVMETFLSFNIVGIPANATITNAALDFSDYSRNGDPFSYYGCIGTYEQNYGAPDDGDYFKGTPIGAIAKWCSEDELSEPLPSNDLISALQHKLGKRRFQVRVQFDDVNNQRPNNVDLRTPKLIVTYTLP